MLCPRFNTAGAFLGYGLFVLVRRFTSRLGRGARGLGRGARRPGLEGAG